MKRYGYLFTCMVSRAVNLETANALYTDAFINALRRFIARRGPVRQLELKESYKKHSQTWITLRFRGFY